MHFNDLIEQIRGVFNISMSIDFQKTYGSLYEFMERINGSDAESVEALAVHAHNDDMEFLDSRISRLITHIRPD